MNRPPVTSPFYLQWERYPYLRGPNYVRPMFREQGPGGNFRPTPVIRLLPPLSGLGGVPWPCWDAPGFKQGQLACYETARAGLAKSKAGQPTPECPTGTSDQTCEKALYEKCFNALVRDYVSAGKCKEPEEEGLIPGEPGAAKSFFSDFFTNPLKLGAALLVLAVVFTQVSKQSKRPWYGHDAP